MLHGMQIYLAPVVELISTAGSSFIDVVTLLVTCSLHSSSVFPWHRAQITTVILSQPMPAIASFAKQC